MEFVRDVDLEGMTGIPQATWVDWRYRRTGPPYFKVGKAVLYDPHEVKSWLAARRVVPTSKAQKSTTNS